MTCSLSCCCPNAQLGGGLASPRPRPLPLPRPRPLPLSLSSRGPALASSVDDAALGKIVDVGVAPSRFKSVGGFDAVGVSPFAFGPPSAEDGASFASRSRRDRPPTAPLNAASNWREAIPKTGRARRACGPVGGVAFVGAAGPCGADSADLAGAALAACALVVICGADDAPFDPPRSRRGLVGVDGCVCWPFAGA